MAAGARLFPRLVEQLKAPSMAPERLTEALRTICDLCSHQESKCQAIASDVVAAATNLLMHDSVPVRRDAVRVISSMALMISGRGLMPIGSSNMARKQLAGAVAGATLPRLAKLLLGCSDDVVKMNVAEALRSLTLFRDGCQQVVDQGTVKGVAQYLCATLPDLPTSRELSLCLLHLLHTLAAATMYASDGMRDLLGIGLIAKVVGFLGRALAAAGVPAVGGEESVEIVRQALRLIWHCGNDPRGRREALKADGVRGITAFLDDKDAKVREAVVCALNVIALETPGKIDVLKHSKEGLARLLLSEDETPYLHETCVQLCRCASEFPDFRFAFARHILHSIWLLEKIYGIAALAAVSPLLGTQEDTETRTQALQVTLHFLQAKPSPGDIIRVPPIAPLANAENPAAFALQECVDILVNLVDLLSVAQEPALACLEVLTDEGQPRAELQRLLSDGTVTIPEVVSFEIGEMLRKT